MNYFKTVQELLLKNPRKNIFFLAFIIGITFWMIIPQSYKQNESTDYDSFYKPVAENILYKRQLIDKEANLTYRYPPGFPVILAGLFIISETTNISKEHIIFIFSVFCIGLSGILIFEISKLFFYESFAFLSSLIFVSYPLLLWTIKQPNSESPFIPLLYTGVLFLIQELKKEKFAKSKILLTGVFWGLAMLIRPIAIGLPFLISLVIIFFFKSFPIGQRLLISLLIISGSVLTISPWESLVYSNEKKIILLSSSGGAGIFDGLTFNTVLKGYRVKHQYPADVEQFMKEVSQKESLNSSPSKLNIFIKNNI